jgi:type VI secretion system protein ImpC
MASQAQDAAGTKRIAMAARVDARIAQIDHLLSVQLNEVIHAPTFQKLEGTWRGLHYLLRNTETSEQLRIKVLNVSKNDLFEDFEPATDYDQSALFKRVYEDAFGIVGAAPFGALIGDYEFGRSERDIELLEKVSQVAAAAHAPFLTAPSPEMFNLKDFTELAQPRDLLKTFESGEYARWNAFRDSEDSRYVYLIVPRMLLREPFASNAMAVEAFGYEEQVDGADHSSYLWGNAAWALATRLTTAFASYGWCAAIRGVEGGGLIEGLPVHSFRTDAGDVAMTIATEVPISERPEMNLFHLGFIPMLHWMNAAKAAFISVQSAHKPTVYDTAATTAAARLSAQLPYVLAVSRFAHYLKAMMRDRMSGSMSRAEVQSYLTHWIENYVVADDDASGSVKANRPLREASIEVQDVPGKPGVYRAVALLRPHFQLDGLTVPIRLVTALPAVAAHQA